MSILKILINVKEIYVISFLEENRWPPPQPLLKTSLKWLTVAMPLLETSKRQERDKTRVRLERDYRDMEDGLS